MGTDQNILFYIAPERQRARDVYKRRRPVEPGDAFAKTGRRCRSPI
jgi:hypothetical protein